MLSEKYYSRQVGILGKKTQKKLKESFALVVGIGGTGSFSAELLCRAGVNLILIDDDIVSESNLNRQALYDIKDLNSKKIDAIKKKLKKINPEIKIKTINEKIKYNNYKKIMNEISEKINIIIDCSDNIKTKLLLNKISFEYNIKLIYSSATEMRSEIYIVDPNDKKRACLNCFLSNKKKTNTKNILNVTPNITATLMINEFFKIFMEEQNKNIKFERKYVLVNLKNLDISKYNISPNPNCEFHKVS